MEDSKKHILSFKEFVENQRISKSSSKMSAADWDERKKRWLASIDSLYGLVDSIIVKGYQLAKVEVKTSKRSVTLQENYLGAYNVDVYQIEIPSLRKRILLSPVGTLLVQAYGRVDMELERRTVKLVMPKWDKWMIVMSSGSTQKLVDLNEANLINVFQQWG